MCDVVFPLKIPAGRGLSAVFSAIADFDKRRMNQGRGCEHIANRQSSLVIHLPFPHISSEILSDFEAQSLVPAAGALIFLGYGQTDGMESHGLKLFQATAH
jgi:hypothetical protein